MPQRNNKSTALPLASQLPATATTGAATDHKKSHITIVERFSTRFANEIPHRVLRELGGVFSARNGTSRTAIDSTERAFVVFCEFLATRTPKAESILSLTINDLHEFVEYLQRRFPPALLAGGRMSNPWYGSYYISWRTALSPFLPAEVWPHVGKPEYMPQDGHSPYAMKQMILALQGEIDRIRAKTGKWREAVATGCVKELEWFDSWTSGAQSSLSKGQIDAIVSYVDNPGGVKQVDFARQLGICHKLLHSHIKSIKSGATPKAKINQDCFDLTIEDIVATIDKYLPDWPVVGGLADHTKGASYYRVYKTEHGVLVGVYQTRAEADAKAAEIGGVVVSDMTTASSLGLMNPAEQFIKRSRVKGTSQQTNIIIRRINELLPDGLSAELHERFFPTSYDVGVVLLYWSCLTGWNHEAMLSVPAFQLKQMSAGNNALSPLSSDHVTFHSAGVNKQQNTRAAKVSPPLTGQKVRGQQRGRTSLFTHVSDMGEPYGLFRVLLDFYELGLPLRKYLDGVDVNAILVGSGRGGGIVGMGSGKVSPQLYLRAWNKFFELHQIFEDEEHCVRIQRSTVAKIRSTYFSTMQELGVPITLQMFLGGHKSLDTTLLSYADDSVSRGICKRKARAQLDNLQDKAFKGQLKRYEQDVPDDKVGSVQVFTHLDRDILTCMDPYDPTWQDHELYVELNDNGDVKKACDHFHMCLFCKQCIITITTLPYLIRWQEDIRRWKKESGFGILPEYMYRRYQAVCEVLDECRATGGIWIDALNKATALALSENFSAPMLWRSI